MTELFVSGLIATIVFVILITIFCSKDKNVSALTVFALVVLAMTVVAAFGMVTEQKYENLLNNVTNVVLPQVELYTQEELDNLTYKDHSWVMDNCSIQTSDGKIVYVKAKRD